MSSLASMTKPYRKIILSAFCGLVIAIVACFNITMPESPLIVAAGLVIVIPMVVALLAGIPQAIFILIATFWLGVGGLIGGMISFPRSIFKRSLVISIFIVTLVIVEIYCLLIASDMFWSGGKAIKFLS
jgi:hypothetical protein